MKLTSPAEDHEFAKDYADMLRTKPNAGGTWEQIYLGARGELALARFLDGIELGCLDACRTHLVREATKEDFKRDLSLGNIDVKVTTGTNTGLVVNRLHADVRYVVLHVDSAEAVEGDVEFEFTGWLLGAPEHFEPFRSDPKKHYAHASKLKGFNALYPLLVKEARARRARLLPIAMT